MTLSTQVCLFLILLTMVGGCESAAEREVRTLDQVEYAWKLLAAGQKQDALKIALEMSEQYDRFPFAGWSSLQRVGLLWEALGDDSAALAAYGKLSERAHRGEAVLAVLSLARLRNKRGDYLQSRELLDLADRLPKPNPDILIAALQQQILFYREHNNLGGLRAKYQELGGVSGASSILRAAALQNLADLEETQGRIAEAISALNVLVALAGAGSESIAEGYLHISRMQMKSGLVREAADVWGKLLELPGAAPEARALAYLRLAESAASRNELTQAEKLFARASGEAGGCTIAGLTALTEMAALYRKRGDAKLVESTEQLLETLRSGVVERERLGAPLAAAEAARDWPAAIRHLEQRLAMPPACAIVRAEDQARLADAYFQVNDCSNVEQHAQQSLAVPGVSTHARYLALYSFALCQKLQGWQAEAEKALSAIVQLAGISDARKETALKDLGQIYQSRGNESALGETLLHLRNLRGLHWHVRRNAAHQAALIFVKLNDYQRVEQALQPLEFLPDTIL